MKTLVLHLALLAPLAAFAQSNPHGHHMPQHSHQNAPHHSPYATMADRPVKALSNEQIAAIRAGRGMGLAMAAELNGYPGPLHVLELAEPLKLTAAQKQQTEKLFNEMLREAKQSGELLIEKETELDRLFRDKRASTPEVARLTEQVALAQGKLRATHLQYHLKMMDVLTPEQVTQYNQLRGYTAGN